MRIKNTQSCFVAALLCMICSNVFSQSFAPSDITNLALWLRADTGVTITSGKVSGWNDISGNGLHAVQTNASVRPTDTTSVFLNNYHAIYFDGANKKLDGVVIPYFDSSSITVFLLVSGGVNSSSNAGIFGTGVNATGWLFMEDAVSGKFKVINNATSIFAAAGTAQGSGFNYCLASYVKDIGDSSRFYYNGSLSGNAAIGGNYVTPILPNTNYSIGRTNYGNAFKGYVAEIIVYTKLLTDVERQQVEQYVFNRYTNQVSLGTDITEPYSLCPVTLNAGNNFVNYNWSTGQTTPQIQVATSGIYSVTATDVFGRISADTIVVSLPKAILNQQDTIVCMGSTLNIDCNLSGASNYSFLWTDGSSTPSYSVSSTGNYYVKVTDTNNCFTNSDTILVAIDSFGTTVSLGPDVSLCSGNSIQTISPSSGLNSYTFLWSTNSVNSSIVVNTSGAYNVTVTDVNGCSGTDNISVSITGTAPTVIFTGSNLCLGNPYSPTNSSTSGSSMITGYNWSFGNGDIATVANPSYIYAASGSYLVTLEITNQDGCSASATQTVIVRDNPTADFIAGAVCANNSFQFTDMSIAPSGETLTQWYWDFGDASSSTSQNAIHTYTVANTYAVSLTVTASNNCQSSVNQSIQVVGSSPLPSTPTLIQPTNNNTLTNPSINFLWNSSTNASNYTLEVSTDNFSTTAQSFSNINTTNYNFTLAGNQTYFWRVTAYNICGNAVQSTVNSFTVFNPVDVSNLSLWLRADSGVTVNNGTVTQWADSGPFHLDCSAATTTIQPTKVNAPLLNGMPTVRFDGNDKLTGLEIPNFATSSSTVFVVVAGDGNTSGNAGVWGMGVNATGWMLMVDAINGNFKVINNATNVSTVPGTALGLSFPYRLFRYTKDIGIASACYLNSQASGNPGVGGAYVSSILPGTAYSVGKTNFGSGFIGNIAEVIVYTKLLSQQEQTQVENYLYSKYASIVNLGPDIDVQNSVCPVTLDASNRFIDYLWSTGETESTISVTKSGYYYVRTTDVFNRISHDTIYVSFPYLGMSSNDTAVCLNQPINLSANMINGVAFQYQWNDGNTTTNQTVIPSMTGDYYCVISDGVCTYNSDTIRVLFDSLELHSLFPTDTAVCSGNDLLADGGISLPGNVLWNTGDTTVSITVTAPGLYAVNYTDVYGCNVKDTTTVTIKGQAPATDFTVSVACLGDPVHFTDVSSAVAPDNIVNWVWSFGDGQTGNGIAVQNQFANLQQYIVTHTVLTDSGCTGIKTKTITVSPKPLAELTYSGVVCAGTTAQFLDNSQVLLTDNITQWKWIFNNTDVFTITNPIYEFPLQGEVPVCLSVTTNNGCVDSMCSNIEVFAPLTANFSATNFCMDDSVSFTDLTPSFSVVGWQWNFDDGSFFGTTKNPKHQYTAPGNYTVRLRVENAIGCSDTTTKTIQVMALPDAAFTNQNTCEDQFYSPVDNSISLSEPITNWVWNIGSANYSGQSVQHFFADTGTYLVKLKVTTASGCIDSVQQTVKIYPSPVADFDFTPLYGEAPVDVTFNNLSAGAATYIWSFGDGNSSSAFTPTNNYISNDTFTIQLQATSAFGCNNYMQKEFIVIKTDLDLSIDKVKTIQTLQADGSTLVTVIATISNVGTRTITHFQVYATLGDGTLISEEWNGALYSGQIMDYTFAAHFVVTAGNANTFVCADAKSVNSGQTELRIDNNTNCASLTETLQLSGPSPNPAFRNSILGIILPKAGKVQLAIADVAGRYTMKEYELNLADGRNNFVLPIHELQAAEYFIRVRYNDETQVRKLIVR